MVTDRGHAIILNTPLFRGSKEKGVLTSIKSGIKIFQLSANFKGLKEYNKSGNILFFLPITKPSLTRFKVSSSVEFIEKYNALFTKTLGNFLFESTDAKYRLSIVTFIYDDEE